MKSEEQKHFDRIAKNYQKASGTWEMLYEQIEERINSLVTDQVVLDIGNGGRFAYDLSLPSQIIVTDISADMLFSINDPNIIKIVSDARNMHEIENNSVDVIIFVLVLHHINGNNIHQSIETLEGVLSEARSKLRPGGCLVVAEALLSPMLFKLQCFLFQLTRSFLHLFGISMIFFFTQDLLAKRIAKVFQIEPRDIETSSLSIKGWLDPLGGSFPGLIKIPVAIQPWIFRLMIATR
ncbi:MAG TPA: class I SAM-dependent methyltransferase, partial [Methylobacter sp.]